MRLTLACLLILTLPAAVWAFSDATLLDNFNRANETPLAGTSSQCASPPCYSDDPITTAASTMTLTTNAARRATSPSGEGAVWWNPTTFGPDSRITATALVGAAGNYGMYVRLSNGTGTATVDGYRCLFLPGADIRIHRIDAMVHTQLAQATTHTVASGDKIGCEATGTGATVTISAWIFQSGSWTQVTSFADTAGNRVVAAGHVGWNLNSNSQGLDDFGACTLSGAECPTGVVPQVISIP